MLNKLIKKLVDLIYGTNKVRKAYEQSNPEEKVLAADASKGIITSEDQGIKKGVDWLTSQRAVIILTESKIVCGKWTILIEEIKSAELLKFRAILSQGAVLKIQTKEGINYQFGMQINPEWIEQQVLPLSYKKAKVKLSPFSLVVRVLLIVYLVYWIYDRFIAN